MKITFDKSAAQFLLDTFEEFIQGKGTECIFCKDEITTDNLAAIIPDGLLCNNFVCLVDYSESVGIDNNE